MFLGIEGIVFFRFYGNILKTIPGMVFKHLILMNLIVTSDSKICCIKPCRGTICVITSHMSHNCQGLMKNNILATMMLIVASLIITFNLILVCRLIPQQNTCFNIISMHLNISDLSCGMYIISVATGSIYFDTRNTLNEMHWKNHMTCYISCVLYTYFQLTSVAVILFMALARWLVTKYPLTSRFKHFSCTSLCLRCITVVKLVFSVLCTLIHTYYSDLHMLPNALCIIFFDEKGSHYNQYLAVFLSFVQLSACIIVIVLSILLCVPTYQSLKILPKHKQLLHCRRFVIQIIFISSCHFIGWFSSAIMYLSSVIVKRFPVEILLFATISFTPFNSFINPIFIMILNRKGKID